PGRSIVAEKVFCEEVVEAVRSCGNLCRTLVVEAPQASYPVLKSGRGKCQSAPTKVSHHVNTFRPAIVTSAPLDLAARCFSGSLAPRPWADTSALPSAQERSLCILNQEGGPWRPRKLTK